MPATAGRWPGRAWWPPPPGRPGAHQARRALWPASPLQPGMGWARDRRTLMAPPGQAPRRRLSFGTCLNSVIRSVLPPGVRLACQRRSRGRTSVDPADEDVDLLLRPGAVAGHGAGLQPTEYGGGALADVDVRPQAEGEARRLPVAAAEQQLDVLPKA